MNLRERHPSLPYVLPFVSFLALLMLAEHLHFLGVWEYPFRVAVLAAILWVFSRHVIDLRVRHLAASLGIGAAVFVIWVGPDLLFPGYRQHWLFQNAITGGFKETLAQDLRSSPIALTFRIIRAVVIVAIVEELFWRAWLMRWLINQDFRAVPLGAYSTQAMWIVALLFASEHGPYWDVGLVTGLIYNWWMVRTKSLGDCILAHAVTNGILSAYVLISGRWEYWM